MKKFFGNFFITGMAWLLYNTFFFLAYAVFQVTRIASGKFGLRIEDTADIKEFRIVLAIFSVLLILFFIGFFFMGKKVLFKCKNSALTFLSCFSSYVVIAFLIMCSNTQLAFTRSYLDVLFRVIFTKAQDFTPPFNDAAFWDWEMEVMDRHILAMDLATSNLINTLFALLPFGLMFLGLLTRKKFKEIKTAVGAVC